ncbi:MAG: amidohydrolase/deacetylase family metallohydrolase [Planctomycetes bacterium]|nr:amidohydrolase/deacetylase family metallohydrolase [Planctomycetota bacterium]
MSGRTIVRGGTLVDPAAGINGRRDLALEGGRVAAVEARMEAGPGDEEIDASGLLVTPGLIDLHVHVFAGVSHYGVEVDPTCLAKGVTTAVDAGTAGAFIFPGFRKYVIEVCETRLKAFLNISCVGLVTGAETNPSIGELEEIRYAHVPSALAVVEKNRDVILGIKIRLSANLARNGENELPALKLAREAADAAGLPVMIHTPKSSLPLPRILAEMRRGDILTHCFHGHESGILNREWKVLPEVRQAIERGVHLDVGHGKGSFTFRVAETAMRQGVLPGTISSDLHRYNVNGPVFDLATTVSKFLLLGMPLEQAIERVTSAPAAVMGMAGLVGTLRVGAAADLALFELQEGRFEFVDTFNETRVGERRMVPKMTIRNGTVRALDGQLVPRSVQKSVG